MTPTHARAMVEWMVRDGVPSDARSPDPDELAAWNALWHLAGFEVDPGLSATSERLHAHRVCAGLLGDPNCVHCEQAFEVGAGVVLAPSLSSVVELIPDDVRSETGTTGEEIRVAIRAQVASGALRVLSPDAPPIGLARRLDPLGVVFPIATGEPNG